jgi:hypothetical protein
MVLIPLVHIITCAPGEVSDIFKDTIDIKRPSPTHDATSQPTIVRFTDPKGQVYFLPYGKCQNWFVRRLIYYPRHCIDLLTFAKGLLETIGKEFMPISQHMASETRPDGWELKFENHQTINDENWVAALAESASLILNLSLHWKSSDPAQLHGYGLTPQPGHFPYQSSAIPYGMAAGPSPYPPPGYGRMPTGSMPFASPGYGGTMNLGTNGYEPFYGSSPPSVAAEPVPFTAPENPPEAPKARSALAEAIEREKQMVRLGKLVEEISLIKEQIQMLRQDITAADKAQEVPTRMYAVAKAKADHEQKVWGSKAAALERAISEARVHRERALKTAEELEASVILRKIQWRNQEVESYKALGRAKSAYENATKNMEVANALLREAVIYREEARKLAEETAKMMKDAAPITLRDDIGRAFTFPFQTCWSWHASHPVQPMFLTQLIRFSGHGKFSQWSFLTYTRCLRTCGSRLLRPGC